MDGDVQGVVGETTGDVVDEAFAKVVGKYARVHTKDAKAIVREDVKNTLNLPVATEREVGMLDEVTTYLNETFKVANAGDIARAILTLEQAVQHSKMRGGGDLLDALWHYVKLRQMAKQRFK